MNDLLGRRLLPGPTDQAAEHGTPKQPLRLIPPAARDSFVPFLSSLPGLKYGENDLTRIAPGRPMAMGDPIEVSGILMDEFGQPIRRALIEIWNANEWGRYLHVKDPAIVPVDPNFFGYGRTMSDDGGRYRLRTIMPGAYLARADIGRWRPKHIHPSIRGGSARLITQMYFRGDKYLEGDPAFILLGDAQERHFTNPVDEPTDDGVTLYNWDIVVGSRNASYFEER